MAAIFEFAQPMMFWSEKFWRETRIVLNMLKPCSVQIWDLYPSGNMRELYTEFRDTTKAIVSIPVHLMRFFINNRKCIVYA